MDLSQLVEELFKGLIHFTPGNALMLLIGGVLIALAVIKEYEPVLLLPIGFGCMLANIPLTGMTDGQGLFGVLYTAGIRTELFPLLIFVGIGAMIDFSPLLAQPKMVLLGAAGQFGIFGTLILATLLGFSLNEAASIGIIGAIDGPTAIFVATRLAPRLLAPIAVAAYSYMSLIPIIQPPLMKLLTTQDERRIRMEYAPRPVSRRALVAFPIIVTLVVGLLVPDATPLISMLMLGNLLRESQVVDRLRNADEDFENFLDARHGRQHCRSVRQCDGRWRVAGAGVGISVGHQRLNGGNGIMCGIFGIVTAREEQLGPILIEAGKRLAYRGYDSVGCATLREDGTIDLRKDVGRVAEVAERLQFAEMRGRRGITQLRWATFGAPSQVNAQPHLDSAGRMVGAHNGNVVNNVELRESFIAEGMVVRSTNDGESCVHAVERYVRQGCDMVTAIRQAYQDLQGDYAFVIGARDDDKLYAIKKGSGLVVGLVEGATCCSSDLPSILPLTRRILRVQDGEIVILSASRVELRQVSDGSVIERAPEIFEGGMETAEKGGYPHFMLKEIHEQPKVAEDLLHLLNASPYVAAMVEQMRGAQHLYLVGCGTSYHACLVGAVYLNRLAGKAAFPVLAPQFIAQYGDAIGPQDVGIFVSQSGETKDVLNAVETAQAREMEILGLVNVLGSTLMNVSQYYLPLACGYEISVPATKTFLNQALAFLYLALRLGGHSTADLARLPAMLEETLERVEPQLESVLPGLNGCDDLYCLGYGLTYGIALEGALKLKEITYAHCEGMLSTEFKHGPLSAVHDDYPVLFVAGPEDVPLLVSAVNEVTCRGGRAIAVAQEDAQLRRQVHDYILLPPCDPSFTPLLAALPLQLLSYQMSVARGIDPDFPRNLSKTLTVD